jgi:hypothetical protein
MLKKKMIKCCDPKFFLFSFLKIAKIFFFFLLFNQIYLVMFMCFTVDTSSIFKKNSKVAKCFFYICNADRHRGVKNYEPTKVWKLDFGWVNQRCLYDLMTVLRKESRCPSLDYVIFLFFIRLRLIWMRMNSVPN